MLFHHSCVTHLGQAPIVVVHGDEGPLAPGYRLLEKKGGIIQRLPSMRHAGTLEYAPRNLWATLKGVETSAENIFMCDPDFVFLRKIDFAAIAARLKGEAVNIEQIDYMTVGDHNRPILEAVCKKAWIATRVLDDLKVSGGTPYFVPARLRRRLAREWASLTEDYLVTGFQHYGAMNSEVWISVMWGFVLAALRIGIPISLANMCVTNFNGQTWRASSPGHYGIVHYCYGDDFFDKRRFMSEEGALSAVWNATAPEGTVNAVVAKALREAAEFYGLV